MHAAQENFSCFAGSGASRLTYEEGRLMLEHPDAKVRMRAAARQDLAPELLFFLAGDPDARVRKTALANPRLPSKAWLVLARDHSPDIRLNLARRLSAIFSNRDYDEEEALVRAATSVLRLLARDELPRVRIALAQAVRTMPDAPHDVILAFARDPDIAVSLPVLELSRVLTDADLIDIIRSSPLTAQLDAVSRRVSVSESVVDAIVRTGDARAIETLLRNSGAIIREQTLDLICDLAPAVPAWHEALVRRPRLPTHLAKKIATFVSDALVAKLAERADLDPSCAVFLREMTRAHLEQTTNDDLALATDPRLLRLSFFRAESLLLSGRLGRNASLAIIDRGLSALGIAVLAVLAKLPVGAVAAAVQRGNARELLAIAWLADFSPQDAVLIQAKLGRLPPDRIVGPSPNGWYAATEDELRGCVEKLRASATENG